MPGYIAWVYVYGMATQLAQRDGEFMRWNEEGFRQTYYEKLVAGVDEIVQNVQAAPEPEVTTFDETEPAAEEPAKASEPPEEPEESEEPEDEEEGEPEPANQLAPEPKTGERHSVPQLESNKPKAKSNASTAKA